MRSNRAIAQVAILWIVIAVGGAAFGLSKTKYFDGQSRRAKAATEATASVEATTAKVDDTSKALSSAAAADVATIGHANSVAPDSPSKTFIGKEVASTLSKLPAPDAAELILSQARENAVLSGQLAEVRRLYELDGQKTTVLQKERDDAIAQRNAAQDAQRRANAAISEAAAVSLAQERQRLVWIGLALLAFSGWAYTKLTHLSPGALAEAVTDIKAGGGISAIDGVTTRLQQWIVRHMNLK